MDFVAHWINKVDIDSIDTSFKLWILSNYFHIEWHQIGQALC